MRQRGRGRCYDSSTCGCGGPERERAIVDVIDRQLTFGVFELEADATIRGFKMREESVRLVEVERAGLVLIL